jgi:ATP-dependent helicase IRC3
MLVLAHRRELIEQAADKLRHWNPTAKVTIEQGDQRADPNADIVVASVQSITRDKRRAKFDWNRIRLCVVDEAHHVCAESYQRVLADGGFLNPENGKLLVGVTATPNRSDGLPLKDTLDEIVFNYPLRRAILDGWLCDISAFRIRTDTSLDAVRTTAGDFNAGELADTVNTPERNALIVSAWRDNARGRKTIAFTADVQHAKDLASAFRTNGIAAEPVWGEDPERAEKLQRHRSGETQVITNCNLLTEGFDSPAVDCIVLARPTKSSLLLQQMAGRGTRLHEGKTECVLLDIVDNLKRGRLQTVPTLLGLPDKLDTEGRSLVEAAKELEAAQAKYPDLDLSKLERMSQLKVDLERLRNLWEWTPPVEIEEVSGFNWHQTGEGKYALPVRAGSITVEKNLLDKFDAKVRYGTKAGEKTFNTLRDAWDSAKDCYRTMTGGCWTGRGAGVAHRLQKSRSQF